MIKTTVKIDGMACTMCEAHINDSVRNNFNIKKVSSSFKKGESVIISDNSLNREKLVKCIEDTGYKINGIKEEDYVKKGLFSFGK